MEPWCLLNLLSPRLAPCPRDINLLLKRLFVLQILHNCLLLFAWVSSEDNEMADLLSREGGIERFPEAVARRAFVVAPASLQAMPGAGRVRNLDMSPARG